MRIETFGVFIVLIGLEMLTACGTTQDAPKRNLQPTPAAQTEDEAGDATPDSKNNKEPSASDAKTCLDECAPGPDTSNAPETPKMRARCGADTSLTAHLEKLTDIVKLLNSLPKPVTLPCLFDVLPRPLHVTATRSGLSVQPAVDEANPRIFVTVGPLILAVVPSGAGAKLLEMSELLTDSESIKGEIAFPLTTDLSPFAPYERILAPNGQGTKCAFCHAGENKEAGDAYGALAFRSKALRSQNNDVMPLSTLQNLAAGCLHPQDSRCELINSIFGTDLNAVQEQVFPDSMPTLF